MDVSIKIQRVLTYLIFFKYYLILHHNICFIYIYIIIHNKSIFVLNCILWIDLVICLSVVAVPPHSADNREPTV